MPMTAKWFTGDLSIVAETLPAYYCVQLCQHQTISRVPMRIVIAVSLLLAATTQFAQGTAPMHKKTSPEDVIAGFEKRVDDMFRAEFSPVNCRDSVNTIVAHYQSHFENGKII